MYNKKYCGDPYVSFLRVMANSKVKTEGGQGGKLGHSNMHYWGTNDEAKDSSRKRRRKNSKRVIEEEVQMNDKGRNKLTD